MRPGHAPAACERRRQEFGAPMQHPPRQQDQEQPGTDKSRDHNKRDISPTSFDRPLCSAEPCRTTVYRSKNLPKASPPSDQKGVSNHPPHDHQQEIDVSHVAHIKQNLATGWPTKIPPAGKALVRTALAPIAPWLQAKDFAQKTPSLKALR